MKRTRIAGGVVVGSDGRVVVVEQKYKAQSLPKGHVDSGETDREAAEREIFEESGIRQLEYIQDLGKYERYKIAIDGGDNKTERKTIVMFLYRTSQTKLEPQDPTNPQAQWVEVEEVSNLLTHARDKEFFEPWKEMFVALGRKLNLLEIDL